MRDRAHTPKHYPPALACWQKREGTLSRSTISAIMWACRVGVGVQPAGGEAGMPCPSGLPLVGQQLE